MPRFAARRFQSIDTVYASPSLSGGVEMRPDSSKCHPKHSFPFYASATVGARLERTGSDARAFRLLSNFAWGFFFGSRQKWKKLRSKTCRQLGTWAI